MAGLHRCLDCWRLTEQERCEEHASAKRQRERRHYTGTRGLNYGRRWGKARARYLSRDPLCVACQREGRVELATQLDHVIPHRGDIELFWSEANWQGLCGTHHGKKTAAETWGQSQPFTSSGGYVTPATIVCGPPGSGKTTYVSEHAQRGDLILDLDALFVALSGTLARPSPMYDKPSALMPFVLEARNAILGRLGRANDLRHAWVITTASVPMVRQTLQRQLHASLMVLDVPAEDCLARIRGDARRATHWQDWEPLIAEWWEHYQRDGAPDRHAGPVLA